MFKSLEVVTAPIETKLTTLDRLKADLALTQETDDFLNAVIDLASAEISAFMNQGVDDDGISSIARQTFDETIMGLNGCYDIYMSRFPVGSVERVSENGSTINRQLKGSNGVTVAAVNTFSSVTGGFTAALEGQAITVEGAGVDGADLVTTVARVVDANNIELADNAVTAVSAAPYAIENPGFPYKINKGTGKIVKLMGYNLSQFLANHVVIRYTAGWILPGQEGENLPNDIQGAAILHCSHKLEQLRNADSDMARIRSEHIEGVGRVEYAVSPRDFKSSMTGEVKSILNRYSVMGFF